MTATVPPGTGGGAMDPEDRPAPSAAHEFLSGGEMTLFEHLNELRSRLFKAALGIAIGFILGLVFSGPLFDFLIQPYCEVPAELRAPTSVFDTDSCRLVNTRVLGAFLVVVKTAGIVAAVVGGPVFFYQLWRFITPGLRPVERRYAIPFIALSQFLFLGGAAFAYWIIPRGLKVLLGIGGPNMVALLDASEYVGFLLKTLIGFGLSFEAPLIIAMLTLAGLVDATSLRKYRRHAIFGAFVLAAFITPTTDPFTMFAMAAPLVLFYEGNIIFARIIHRRRARAATA